VCLGLGVIGCDSQGESDLKTIAELQERFDKKKPNAGQGANKIGSKLLEVIHQLKADSETPNSPQGKNLEAYSTPFVKVSSTGDIRVYVHLRTFNDVSLETLKAHNLQIEISNAELRIVQGWIPYYSVESLAQLPVVEKIQAPSYDYRR
jgi:hypothetical protein